MNRPLIANAWNDRNMDVLRLVAGLQTKHNHYGDFGYPEDITFAQAYVMYERNGLARAGVEKTVGKTWQDNPFLQDHQRDGSAGPVKETPLEAQIRERFADLRIWQHLAEADRRSMVGAYSGVILRLADSKPFKDPVDTVPGGLNGLVEVIPAWEGQLSVSQYDTEETSPSYGQPLMFQFNEAAVGGDKTNPRSFMVHPDRVVIWSKDGTLNGRSALKPGYNALMDMEKVRGAGGEGFWKNAKSAPILEVEQGGNLTAVAKALGCTVDELVDLMNDQVGDWQRGFDQLLMLQGMKATTLAITLPSPEHFHAIALQEFAASVMCPLKILIGSQTGERASTEDAAEWAHTCMGRRTGQVIPNTLGLVRRLERFNILPAKPWHLEWTDLTESSMGEKIDRADKMADVNQKMKDTGEIVFTAEEIREVVDLEPLSDAEKYREPPEDDESGLLDDELPEDAQA